MSKKKIEKVYYFEFWLDEFENNHLIDKAWCQGNFVFKGKCWKDCLYKFTADIYKEMVKSGDEKKFLHSLIGLKPSSIQCDFKLVDFNYIRNFIIDDELLNRFYWC